MTKKIKVSELKEDDIVKVCVPVRIKGIKSSSTSLGVDLNNTCQLSSLSCIISDGPFVGKIALVTASADDKVERIMRGKGRNVFAKVLAWFFG